MDSFASYKQNIFTVASGLVCAPVLFQTMVDFVNYEAVLGTTALILLTTASLITAVDFFTKIPDLLRRFQVSVEPLVAISAAAAWGVCLFEWLGLNEPVGASYALYIVLPIFMLHLGNYLEKNAISAPPAGLSESRYELPETYSPSIPHDEPSFVRDIQAGAHLKVSKGNIIPVDGNVLEGMAEVMGSVAIPRAMPRQCGPGDTVFAGEKVSNGQITVVASKAGTESLLAKAILIDHHAKDDDRARIYMGSRVRVYLILCLIFAFTGLMYQGFMNGLVAGFYTFFICVVLSVPMASVISYILPLEWLSTQFHNMGADLHTLDVFVMGRNVKALAIPVMDGLVRPAPQIERTLRAKASEEEVLCVASGLCSQSDNPLCITLSNAVAQKNLTPAVFNTVQYDPGRGMVGEQNHGVYLMGNPTLLSRYRVPYRSLDDELVEYEASCDQLLWVAQAKPIRSFMGVIACSTSLRHGAEATVSDLKASPYKLVAYALTETPKIINRAKTAKVEDIRVYFDIKSARKDYVGDDAPMASIANNILHVGAFEAADLKIVGRNAPSSMTQRAHISLRAMRPNIYMPVLDMVKQASLKVQQNIYISLMASLGAVLYTVSGHMTAGVANAIALSAMTGVVLNSLLSRRKSM